MAESLYFRKLEAVKIFSRQTFLSSFAILFLVVLIFKLDPNKDLKTEGKVLPPPKGIENVHFGFKEAAADLFWLDFIQHNFECSKYKDPNEEHCPQRWGYETLKSASLLAPKLKALYKFGAVQLSVLLDDHEGAADLFEQGLREYSDDWIINYRAAYLYLEEIKDTEKAAHLMLKAADAGAPFLARSLASRLYDDSGRLELSLRILEDLHQKAAEGPWRRDLESRMQIIVQKIRSNASSH